MPRITVLTSILNGEVITFDEQLRLSHIRGCQRLHLESALGQTISSLARRASLIAANASARGIR